MHGKKDGAVDAVFEAYRKLGYPQRNELALRLLRDQLGNQKYLLYAWPVQQLYARYAHDFLPVDARFRILELGPGDNLMGAALWMLDERLDKLTLFDKFKGQYVDSAAYNEPVPELIAILKQLPRPGFNNYYPFERQTIEPVTQAIHLKEDGSVELNRERLEFVLGDDFTRFPFDDGAFNYVYSHAALEHYQQPEASIAEMNRVLELGGLMVHQIDIRDHRFFEKDPFRYLEQSPEAWNFGAMCFPVNQWRAFQFRDAFLRQGFEIVKMCKVRQEPEKLEGIVLAKEFAAMPRNEVSITGIVFILKKIGEARRPEV